MRRLLPICLLVSCLCGASPMLPLACAQDNPFDEPAAPGGEQPAAPPQQPAPPDRGREAPPQPEPPREQAPPQAAAAPQPNAPADQQPAGAEPAAAEPAAPPAPKPNLDKWNDAHSIFRLKQSSIAWSKLLLVWLLFLIWVKSADWVNRDTQIYELGYGKWNPIMFFPFLAVLLLVTFP